MARATLTALAALGAYGTYGANLADLPMTAADVANKNEVVATNNDLIIAHNTGGSAYTVTVTSVADPSFGRTGDIAAYSVGAGEYAAIGPMKNAGWKQADGKLYFEASNAAVKLGVVALGG
jgi:hypothetical protein